MKKRLSDNHLIHLVIMIGLIGLFFICVVSLDVLILAPVSYGVIKSHIPVLQIHQSELKTIIQQSKIHELGPLTPTFVMGHEGVFFGALEAFSKEVKDGSKKIFVPYEHRAINLVEILHSMEEWQQVKKMPKSKEAILVPSSEIPMAIVIEFMESLKKEAFENVILGGIAL